jgi:stage II sporulation protein D
MKKAWKRNKRIKLIAALLVLLCFGMAAVSGASEEEIYLKVGLYYGGSGLPSSTLQSDDGFILFQEEGGSLIQIKSLAAYKTLELSIQSGDIILRDAQGTLISKELAAGSVLMSAAEDEEDKIISIDGSEYRDGVIALPNTGSTITIINYVTLEHYLRGVLNAEMSYAYPMEALKAQAVCARSYAIDNLGKHSKYGFDLCSGTCCQVYKGVSAEHEETDGACSSTSGLVMMYEGKVVPGYYSANSGGYTQNSEDVWSAALGYLRAVKDDFAPLYPWSTSITFDTIKSRLETAGYSPGPIQSVAVAERNETGSVSELIVTGSNQTVSLKKEAIRIALGSSVLKSLRFSMGAGENPEIITLYDGGGLSVQSAQGIKNVNDAIHAISSDGQVEEIPISELVLLDGFSQTGGFFAGETETKFTEETVDSGTVFFNGIGYGHGVGMSQTSARAMAVQGWEYRDILDYFYTDITIASLYGIEY